MEEYGNRSYEALVVWFGITRRRGKPTGLVQRLENPISTPTLECRRCQSRPTSFPEARRICELGPSREGATELPSGVAGCEIPLYDFSGGDSVRGPPQLRELASRLQPVSAFFFVYILHTFITDMMTMLQKHILRRFLAVEAR